MNDEITYERGYEFEEISAQDGCGLLINKNPDLGVTISKVNPSKEHTFLKVTYRYGDPIILKSGAYLPTPNGKGLSFNDKSLPEGFRKKFGFDPKLSNPMGVILNKNCERYGRCYGRIVPQEILYPGDLFGLSKLNNINPKASSNASAFFNSEIRAGVKSAAMAPKITDARQHDRLQLSIDKPTSYSAHWDTFREIAVKYDSDWRVEVLFFSNSWFESLKQESWSVLLAYLTQLRIKSSVLHNIQAWFSNLNDMEILYHLKKYPGYALDIARHLLAIAANVAPAFRPATDDSGLPTKLIQEVYIEKYRLDYAPIIMEIAKFSEKTRSLYYFLNNETAPQTNPEANYRSIITLLSHVKEIITRLQQGILNDKEINITFPALYQAALDTVFSFFHNDPMDYKNIKKLSLLAEEDESFMRGLSGVFPEHSVLLNGCIKIALRK